MNWRVSASFGELLTTWRTRCHLTQTALAAALGTHRNTIGRWERGEVLPETRGMVLELARLLRLDEQEARLLLEASLTALTPYWTVPFRRNPSFTGREALLHQLHTHLAPSQPIALTQTAALSGLGGIGKTQLAVEYAYRYALSYTAVFWLAAETAGSLMGSLQQIADQLQLPDRQGADQRQMVATVQRWLNRHDGWLLIADNVEDSELLQRVLPATRQGMLLLTTRHQTLGTLAQMLEVPLMRDEEGVALLLRRTHRLDRSPTEEDTAAATELVRHLEGLPLALDQAGAYIDETTCSIAEYLQRYHQQRGYVLARRGMHGGAHPDSVATTLRLSVVQVEHEQPTAANLLRFCAFLHPESIPEELLRTGLSQVGIVEDANVQDPYQLDLALAALRSASLITRHPETRTLSVHRLMQAVLQDQMEAGEVRQWRTRAICAINAVFPEADFAVWGQCERALPHALACFPWIASLGGELPEASELLYKTGSYLLARGLYQEAEPWLEQAVTLAQQQQNPDYPMLLLRLEKRAELFWRQGKQELVEPLLRRVLELEEQHLGPTHAKVGETLNNLAVFYLYQQRYAEAEPLYQRALDIQEHQLGPEHSEVATTLNNLASLYREQGRYEEAETLHLQALRIRERHLGPEHPEVALTLITLAGLYLYQQRYAEAEEFGQRGLGIREQHLGAEHPDTALTLTFLATLYAKQEHFQRAESLYQRAWRIQEQQLGPEHPQTVRTLKNLAALYREQDKDEQAEALSHQTVAISEQVLGSAHPQTVGMRQED